MIFAKAVVGSASIPGSDHFLDRGILGVVALLSILAAIYLFRLLTKERENHIAEIKAIRVEHAAELKDLHTQQEAKLDTLFERLVEGAKEQQGEDRELLEKLTDILESFANRVDTRRVR